MKPTTLEEALAMVPTHWMLSSRRDKWQKGDQYFAHNLPFDDSDDNWVDVGPYHIESIEVVMPDELGRRPIPQDVRESAAWWLLYNTLATVDPIPRFDQLLARFIITTYGDDIIELNVEPEAEFSGMRGFDGESKVYASIKALGGEQRIIKELSAGPDSLGRWILAGKP